jgi:CheY-like chemotaxis protein
MDKMKILVVDDEQDAELLFVQQFRNEIKSGTVAFHFVLDATAALNYLETLEPFDVVLVLSDINMPGITGIELLKRIKNQFPKLHVVMVTAYDDPHNTENAKQFGASGFITKPVNFHELKQKINELSLQN